MKVGIAVVVFNLSQLIEIQINLIRRYCRDSDFEIIVIDNSNNLGIAGQVQSIADRKGVKYFKTSSIADFSQSHASACNFAFSTLKDNYDYLFLLDHDNFPVADFSVEAVMGSKIIAGVGQARGNKFYYWPGCVIINTSKVDKDLVDFSTNSHLGLDTGGNLYQIIDKYGDSECVNFDQYNIDYTIGSYTSIYNLIQTQKYMNQTFSFMHFINASNWSGSANNDERIKALLEMLKTRVGYF